ncbi:MAG TPA: nuclear transport factor 2 family protein [Rhodopila sp.]|jgi:ketosteroid isomerase-like protein|nr:nuclear transport factor 2 family protein [Rhodopila sp.]
MDIDRRLLTLATLALAATPALAATGDDAAVAKALEAFRSAQFAADAKRLADLCAPELSYSHSDAHIEDKATFVTNATNGNAKMLSLEYQDPTIRVVGDVAIVRFHWVGRAQAKDGKTTDTSLAVLTIWQKQHGDWKLLARASTKQPPA